MLNLRKINFGAIAFALFLATPALLTTGCGFFPPLPSGCSDCTTAVSYMYVANVQPSAPSIAGFVLTTTTTPASGTTAATTALSLSKTPNSGYALSFVPSAMAITPTNTFLYASGLAGGIYIYGINTDRSITLQTTISPVTAYPAVSAMQVDPTGNWLITANLSTSTTAPTMAVYAINTSTGALTVNGTLTLKTVGAAQQLAISPNGTNVVMTQGTGGINAFTFNPTTGALAYVGNVPSAGTLNSDLGVAFNPTSTFCFVTETVASAVRAFSVNATTGALTEISGSPFATGNGPSAVMVDASGDYVYVTNRTDGTVSAFVQAASGALSEITGSPFATGTTTATVPVSIAEDSSKTYVGIVNQGGNPDLKVYTFDATTLGALDAAGTATTGTDPTLASVVVATH
jgi:6-phosphogluconolactonase (cycloisomerase 2 family)